MSFSICRIAKIKSSGVTGIQVHDRREKNISHTNEDINWDKTKDNIDLIDQKERFRTVVKKRINELNLTRALRKDATVMTQCLITSDLVFFQKMNLKEQLDFFEKSYDFIKDRYGEKNMVSATIHFDEKTPHMHVNFVPVTKDGRLSARDLFTPKQLRLLQDDFNKYINDNGYNLERGKMDLKRKHLSVEEFKLETKKEQIENAIKTLSKDEKHIKSAINSLDMIEAKKTPFGAYKISAQDYSTLMSLAKEGQSKILENTQLKAKIGELQEKNSKIQSEKEVLSRDNTKVSSKNIELIRKNKELKSSFEKVETAIQRIGLVDEVNKELKNMRTSKQKNYDMEL